MAPINKGRLIVTLFLFCELFCSLQAINSHGVEELYRALNVTCLEERDLTKEICQSETATCASALLIERLTGDKCAVLYQFLSPKLACNLKNHVLLRYSALKWWSDGALVSPNQLSRFVVGLKLNLEEYYSVDFVGEKCFSTSDILQDQGLSTQKCFSSSSVGKVCSAIVDRLSRGESICDTEVVDDVSCVDDVVEQLFHRLADESGKLTLTQLQQLIDQLIDQLPDDHYRVAKQTEDHHDDHDDHDDEGDHDNHDDEGDHDNHDDENDHDHNHGDENDHGDEDDHDHDHEDAQQSCPTESRLVEEFNHVVEELGLMDDDGLTCYMEQHLNDSHDNDHNLDGHDNIPDDHDDATNCSTVYETCRDLILEIGLTTEACLAGNSSTVDEHDDNDDVSESDAYGWGFLSTVIISVASQLGVIAIVFSYNGQASKYLMSVLIAMGISTLVSDAVLHLTPHGFGIHEEEDAGDGHDHSSEEEHDHDRTVIWRGCCVLGGIFIFYILEFVMSLINKKMEKPKVTDNQEQTFELNNLPNKESHKEANSQSGCADGCLNLDMDDHPAYFNPHQGFCYGISSVAWIIILGDGIHNFADGVAIGASFTSSIGMGISTSLAILFHELPHEFGDFAILLSSGMKWYVALVYNFLSAITAIIGMFVGVAIGNSHEDATAWILSITAGIFFYVALVDLLPLLIEMLNKCEDRRSVIIYMSCHLTGFFIGFAILLLIAIYEEDINSLVD